MRVPFRFSIRIRWLMLAVAAIAFALGGVELARRRSEPRPPLPPPGVVESSRASGSITVVYVNGDDLRAGIDLPRKKFVFYARRDVELRHPRIEDWEPTTPELAHPQESPP
jgi:hypothetical protein